MLLGYFVWLVVVYIDVFYIHIDAQSSIALLFVGAYAYPVLAIFWIGTFIIEMKSRIGRQEASADVKK